MTAHSEPIFWLISRALKLSLKYYQLVFLALPYYSQSSAKSIHSCFLYTTQGDAGDAELQEGVPIIFVHKSMLISLNHAHQYEHRQLTFCVSGSCLDKK